MDWINYCVSTLCNGEKRGEGEKKERTREKTRGVTFVRYDLEI